jgi:hypothetical protein
MRKRHFAIRPDTFLCLVHLAEGAEADIYLIPSLAWHDPRPPFASYDYVGKKSEPEHGLSVSRKTLPMLAQYRFADVLPPLLDGSWPDMAHRVDGAAE